MVVNDFDVVGITFMPTEAQPPLIIDPDGVLPFAITFERFRDDFQAAHVNHLASPRPRGSSACAPPEPGMRETRAPLIPTTTPRSSCLRTSESTAGSMPHFTCYVQRTRGAAKRITVTPWTVRLRLDPRVPAPSAPAPRARTALAGNAPRSTKVHESR